MFLVDQQYSDEFGGKINQIFCYITSRCNADCVQCLYKPMTKYSLLEDMIDRETMINLLAAYRALGAIKVTFIGGEPSLHKDLPEFIRLSKELGYRYVRIDTNALFDSKFLENEDVKLLDEITVSLDDYIPEINDEIRGKDYFRRCVANIRRAQDLGYKIQLTTCIHNRLTIRDEDGRLRFDKMIDFAESLGLSSINFHTLFRANVPRDTWSGNIHTTVDEYLQLIKDYGADQTINNNREISVRFPQGFVTQEDFEANRPYYGFCSVKLRDRALISHDGTIRVCALMLGTAYYTAYFDREGIHYNNTPTNEMLSHKMDEPTPCTHQSKRNGYRPYVPTCISFKPAQNEIVWLDRLKWESKRSKST
jgi:molybdenum cofactor biosynthesis enzyme MoaA